MMKMTKLVYPALSLSLALMACTPQAPVGSPDTSAQNIQSSAAQLSNAQQATQSVRFTYIAPKSFSTQVVDPSEVKFIKLTLVGDGINGSLSNSGDFIALDGNGKATATIAKVPIAAGKLRVATVQGYDANKQPLAAFVGKGYYISQSGQTTITITIDRSRLLTGQALEKLLKTNPAAASNIDITALQAAVDMATGFNSTTGKFTNDPTLFDANTLATSLETGTIPTGNQIQTDSKVNPGNVVIEVKTKNGYLFTEALTLAVNDPNSSTATIALFANSPQTPSVQVSPGEWTLSLKKGNTVIATTTVSVSTAGVVTLGKTSLEVQLKSVINSVAPPTGLNTGGELITINGLGFTGATEVKFGNTAGTGLTVISDTQLTVTSPAGSVGTTQITITTPGGSSDHTNKSKFDYISGPTVTSISPGEATIGTKVVLEGANFDATVGNNTVKFGQTPATIDTQAANNSTTQLTVTVPAGISGKVPVTVTDGNNTTGGSSEFSVVPQITGITPTTGPLAGGTTVTLTGTGFTNATSVKFGAANGLNVNFTSSTQITADSPAGTGQLDLTATTTGGTSAANPNTQFTYSDIVLAEQTTGTVQSLNGVGFGNNKYVAVGNNGTIITSPNGTTWTSQISNEVVPLISVAYGNNTYVIGGSVGRIYTSSDGVTWTGRTSGSIRSISDIIYVNNTFVAVGGSGTIITSPDGVTWTSQTSGTTLDLYSVTYVNNIYVAVGKNGTILTSPNGTTWTSRTSGTTESLNGVAYGSNTFVAVGNNGKILASPDGVTWTSQTSGTTLPLSNVAYGNNKFITVGPNGAIFASPNGTTWTSQTSGTDNQFLNVIFDGTRFIVVGFTGKLFFSQGL